MSKTASPELIAHYASDTLTIARCVKLTRKDGVVKGACNIDEDVVYSGVRYKAATGVTLSAIASSADLAVDNLEVLGLFDVADFIEADLRNGLWDDAAFEVFEVNYRDLTMGRMVLPGSGGHIGEVRTTLLGFSAELRGLIQQMQQNICSAVTPRCQANLGDTHCGVNLGPFTVTDTVTAVTDRRTFASSARTEVDTWFDGGVLTWTGGANADASQTMEVKKYLLAGGSFVLELPMPYNIAIGDTYSVHAGCNHLLKAPGDVRGTPYTGHCRSKFGNVVRFYLGFCEVMGNDKLKAMGT